MFTKLYVAVVLIAVLAAAFFAWYGLFAGEQVNILIGIFLLFFGVLYSLVYLSARLAKIQGGK